MPTTQAATVSINPNARERFESRAAALLEQFRPYADGSATHSWEPDRVAELTLGPEQIVGPIVRERLDPKSLRTDQIAIANTTSSFALEGAPCSELDALAETIALDQGMRRFTTAKAVRDRLLRWLTTRLFGLGTASKAIDFIEEQTKMSTSEREIWIPLTGIDVEVGFRIGNVELRPIDAEQIARWDAAHRAAVTRPDQPQALPEGFKKQWQGKTATVITVLGDNDYASQVAMEEAERTCALLRMLEPESRSATWISSLHPEGRPAPDTNFMLTAIQGRPDSQSRSAVDPPTGLRITRQVLHEAWESGGLKEIDKLLKQEPGTAFQQRLLEAALIYSEQRLTRDPVEKLIFALVSLETLLLKDQHEPIRYKLGERLALALGTTADQRQRIIATVFTAYELRSRYLHHGHKRDDLEAVEAMLVYAWEFFLRLLHRQDEFASAEALVQQLDLARLSGPCVLPPRARPNAAGQ